MAGTGTDYLAALAARGLVWTLGRLPSAAAFSVAETLATIVHRFDSRHRRIAEINLRIAFPDRDPGEHRRIIARSYRQLGRHAVDLARLARKGASEVRERVSYDPSLGLEHYRQAKALGRGVIFVTAHISSWELLPAAHAILGHPLSFVVRPLENRALDEWSVGLRERFGNRVISKYGSLKQILRVLQEKEDIGFLIDQNVQRKDGVFAPLFDRPACTTSAPALLALKTGAPVIPGFLIPGKEQHSFRIRFYPHIETARSADRDADVQRYTGLFNSFIEQVIREYPEQWLWGHRRFRTQPDGTDPYNAP